MKAILRRATCYLLFARALSSAAAASPIEVRIRPLPVEPSPSPVEGYLVAAPSGDSGANAPAGIKTAFTTGRELAIHLEPGLTWKLEARADGFWIPDTIVVPVADQPPLVLKLYPSGTLTGRLELGGRNELPENFAFRTRFREAGATPSDPASLEGETDCTIDRETFFFECVVPAGVVDLRLRGTAFVSHYFWDQELPAGQSIDLGKLLLERGASVVGWVETDDDEPLDNCTVEIAPQLGERPTTAQKARESLLKVHKGVDARGFFHLTGLLPGSYALTVQQDGYSPAEIENLLLLENAEAELEDPLVLERPLEMVIDVVPPTDPKGKP